MTKYRRKPVVLDATQYVPGEPLPDGACSCHRFDSICTTALHVHTLEGFHELSAYDWIVTGLKGEQWPVKPDVFAATYELANSPS